MIKHHHSKPLIISTRRTSIDYIKWRMSEFLKLSKHVWLGMWCWAFWQTYPYNFSRKGSWKNSDFDNDVCGGSLNYFCYFVLFHRTLKLELENTNSLLQHKLWSRQLLNLVAHCLSGGPTKISNSFSGQTYWKQVISVTVTHPLIKKNLKWF